MKIIGTKYLVTIESYQFLFSNTLLSPHIMEIDSAGS